MVRPEALTNETLSEQLVCMFEQARLNIPDKVIRKVRLNMADALGIALAARQTPLGESVVQAQLAACGTGSSPLIGGGTASPMGAAFINASLIHILDFDDIYDRGRLHPGAVVLPAVLAAAGITGASDRTLIEAVALGNTLMCRLGDLMAAQGEGPASGWFLTQLFGYFAASLAAGFVFGLTRAQLVSALGLAYMQASGGKQSGFGTGSNARAIYPAFAAQGGLQACLLARAGLSGPAQALDGAASLFALYLGENLSLAQQRELLSAGQWYEEQVNIKPWPCCRLSHPYVATALALRDRFLARDGLSIQVQVNASAARLCRPLVQRRQPETLQDAKYSIPFMTAFALVRGVPTLESLNEAALGGSDILATAARVEIQEGLADNPGHPPAVLRLVDQKGNIFATEVFRPEVLKIAAPQVREKFDACLRWADQGGADELWRNINEGHYRQALFLTS